MKISDVHERENRISTRWQQEVINIMKDYVEPALKSRKVRTRAKAEISEVCEINFRALVKIGEDWLAKNF